MLIVEVWGVCVIMEIEFLQLLALFCAFGAGSLLSIWAYRVYLVLAERKASSIYHAMAGAKGRESQKEMENRLLSFMEELKAAWDNKGDMGNKEFLIKSVVPLGLKYNDVVLHHGTRLIRMATGKNQDLGGIMKDLISGKVGSE